jgi:hypothetical protein
MVRNIFTLLHCAFRFMVHDLYSLRGPLASLNGISVNLAELLLKLQGLFLNVFGTIPKICIYIYIHPNMTYITLYH